MKLIVNVFGITIEIKSMFGIAPELSEFKRNMEVKE